MKFNRLTPNLRVANVRQSILFYRDILGFSLEIAVPSGTTDIETSLAAAGDYAYAMLRRDEVFIMLLDAAQFDRDMPTARVRHQGQGESVLFYMDVEGIGRLHDQLKGDGTIIKEMETTWYGMTEFYISDPDGYILGFAEKTASGNG